MKFSRKIWWSCILIFTIVFLSAQFLLYYVVDQDSSILMADGVQLVMLLPFGLLISLVPREGTMLLWFVTALNGAFWGAVVSLTIDLEKHLSGKRAVSK